MKKVLIGLIVVFAIVFIALEVLVRLKGGTTYSFKPHDWKCEPRSFITSDPLLGYKLDTGTFTFSIEGKPYVSHHTKEGHRITSYQDSTSEDTRQRINFLGGTNVYGQQMNDEETLPFIFQELTPGCKLVNLAVPEYSMGANYVLLKDYIDIKPKDVFICIYFSAHDSRPPRKLLKATYADVMTKTIPVFPTLSIDENLKTTLNDYTYKPWPLVQYSALMNLMENRYNAKKDKSSKAHDISRKVITAIDKECKEKGATFILVGRRDDALTLKMVDFCKENGIRALYLPMPGKSLIASKTEEEKLRMKKSFCGKIADYLVQENLIDSSAFYQASTNIDSLNNN